VITFSQTCDKPYDRHKYKLYLTNGTVEQYEYYDEVQAKWFQTPSQFLSHVEVIDRKKRR
jgi:hypothetical protein